MAAKTMSVADRLWGTGRQPASPLRCGRALTTLFGLFLGLSPVGSLIAQELPVGHREELAQRVQEILQRNCVACHGSGLTKPDGGFGLADQLSELPGEWVVPGDPSDSELWLSVSDATRPMPPSGMLPAVELAAIHLWIAEGAPAPSGPRPTLEAGEEAGEATPERSRWERIGEALGRLHIVVVHFPIALLLLAIGVESVLRGGAREVALRFCLWVGTPAALLAVGAGWLAVGGRGEASVGLHRWTGVAVAGLAALALLQHELCVLRGQRSRWPLRVLLLALAGLTSFTAHLGGELVHAESVWAGLRSAFGL